MAKIMRMMHGWDEKFGDFVLNRLWSEFKSGLLRLNYFKIEGHTLIYKLRTPAVETETSIPKEPKDLTDRTAKGYDPWKDPSRDYHYDLWIQQGILNEFGVFRDPKSAYIGQHYYDVYPKKDS